MCLARAAQTSSEERRMFGSARTAPASPSSWDFAYSCRFPTSCSAFGLCRRKDCGGQPSSTAMSAISAKSFRSDLRQEAGPLILSYYRIEKEKVQTMSVAFTREESAETAAEVELPDRPISPHPNLVTASGLVALTKAMTESRSSYDAAQKIEDAGERRRAVAVCLSRYEIFRRSSQDSSADSAAGGVQHGRFRASGDVQTRRRQAPGV